MRMFIPWVGTGTGRKSFPYDGPGLDQNVTTDRGSDQRLDGWQVGGVAAIRGAKKTDSAGDQWRLLGSSVTDRAKHGQNKNTDPRESAHSGKMRTKCQSPHTATIATLDPRYVSRRSAVCKLIVILTISAGNSPAFSQGMKGGSLSATFWGAAT